MTYVIILLLLVLLELAYFRVADRFNIIDKPNLRSSHKTIVLRGGGIIFLFGVWLYAAFFGLTYPWFIVGLTLVGAISFIDDVHSLPDSLRLVVQFVAMFLMFRQFGILNLHDWWIVIIALIVCGHNQRLQFHGRHQRNHRRLFSCRAVAVGISEQHLRLHLAGIPVCCRAQPTGVLLFQFSQQGEMLRGRRGFHNHRFHSDIRPRETDTEDR